MKKFMIITIFLFSANLLSAKNDSLFVKISGDTVQIWNTNVLVNCGCRFRFDVDNAQSRFISFFRDTINIIEVDTASMYYICLCNFNLSVSLIGLLPGKHYVNVYRSSPSYKPVKSLVGSFSFDYLPLSPLRFLIPFKQYLINGYQSPCLSTTSVKEKTLPAQFKLHSNYPNPFNPSTIIRYELFEEGIVQLKIFDELGKEIKTLVDKKLPAGVYEVEFDAKNLPSGTYFYRLQADDLYQEKKMILLK